MTDGIKTMETLTAELTQLWDDYKILKAENRHLKNETERLSQTQPCLVRYVKAPAEQLWTCEKCNHTLVGIDEDDDELWDKPHYCPNCGGEIVYVITIKKEKGV